jgi:hypothetical protein
VVCLAFIPEIFDFLAGFAWQAENALLDYDLELLRLPGEGHEVSVEPIECILWTCIAWFSIQFDRDIKLPEQACLRV